MKEKKQTVSFVKFSFNHFYTNQNTIFERILKISFQCKKYMLDFWERAE